MKSTDATDPSVSLPATSDKSTLLTISVAANVLVVLVVAGAITVVVLVVVLRRRSRKKSPGKVCYDTAVDGVKIRSSKRTEEEVRRVSDDHVYESLDVYNSGPTGRHSPPTFSAVNTTYSAVKDKDEMNVEENVAYATTLVHMSRNVAYDVVDRRQQGSRCRRQIPLPDLP
jgi:hypothetical protein